MKDTRAKVIYVGKAARLSNRVRQYFASPKQLDPKTQKLVSHIHDFDILITPTEKDALILESQLVKEYKPRYNIRLKDDKKFPWLALRSAEEFPYIEVVRKAEKDGSEYFGPYTDARAMRTTLKSLTSIFPIRTCSLNLPKEKLQRPCLDYFIHRCCAPCVDYIDLDSYSKLVEEVRLFLKGRSDLLNRKLQEKMANFSEELRFEDAARVRDQLAAIEKIISDRPLLVEAGDDLDVLGIAREGKHACGVVLRIRQGKLLRSEKYFFTTSLEEDEEVFFQRFAGEILQESSDPGSLLLLQYDLADMDNWMEILEQKHARRFRVSRPQKGQKLKLIEMARKNARHHLKESELRTIRTRRKKEETPDVLDLKERLQLAVAPHSMECFDMSHFQGSQRVGSLVYFSEGQPLKSRYRRFKIKHVEGIDDFAMMQECMERYYSRLRDEDKLPADLVVVDGGAGQLSVAVKTLKRYGFMETAVIGLAKREEEVYLPGKQETVVMPRSSSGLKMLQRIRDEAHRFAITFHRNLRDKETFRSVLDEIPGIGAVKRRALLTLFGSAEGVSRASKDELIRAPGIGDSDAMRIMEFFMARDGKHS